MVSLVAILRVQAKEDETSSSLNRQEVSCSRLVPLGPQLSRVPLHLQLKFKVQGELTIILQSCTNVL
jgi:hypothetical protein